MKTVDQAVILAAGDSRRFWPLSYDRHKSLFPLENRSILRHTVDSLVSCGVSKFVIVQSPRRDNSFKLPSDDDFSGPRMEVEFVEQPSADGQGDALLRCEQYLDATFLLVQPENINAGLLANGLVSMRQCGDLVTASVQRRRDFPLYAVVSGDGTSISGLVEKPPRESISEEAPYCNMGVYLLDRQFLDVLRPLPRDPFDIIFAINAVAKKGSASMSVTNEPFLPLKVPGHIWNYVDHLAIDTDTRVLADGSRGRFLALEGAMVSSRAILDNVIVGRGAIVEAGVVALAGTERTSGTIVVGDHAKVSIGARLEPGCRIRPGAVVPPGAVVRA